LIPTALFDGSPGAQAPLRGRWTALHKKPLATVYAVDDDPDVLASLHFLLETEGFAVKTFANGSDLLASSLPGPRDCLVIDYRMTGMDGLELVRHLRDRDVSSPVVLVTVYEGVAAKAVAAGIRHVVMKPHIEESLVAHVRAAMDEAGAT
jgi:FixJ family two-component response regulator